MTFIDLNNPPISDNDWKGYNQYDLDDEYACHTYYGLAYTGLLKIIESQSIMERCFELNYLPTVPFKYYTQMFIHFFLSKDFDIEKLDNEYILGIFLEVLITRAKKERFLIDIWNGLTLLLELIKKDKKYSLYEEDTYQDLIEKINEIDELRIYEECKR